MASERLDDIAKGLSDLRGKRQPLPIDPQAMYKAEREFYIQQCGQPNPKDGPLSKGVLGERLAALEDKGIFYRPVNKLLYQSPAERLEFGYLEYATEELKNEMNVVKPSDLDWDFLGVECEAIIHKHAIGFDRYVGEEETNRALTQCIIAKTVEFLNKKFEEAMADTDREKGLEKQCMEEDKGRRKIARLAYRKLREAVGREELRAEHSKNAKLRKAAEQDESVPADTVDHSVGRRIDPGEFSKYNPDLAKLGEPVMKAWLGKLGNN